MNGSCRSSASVVLQLGSGSSPASESAIGIEIRNGSQPDRAAAVCGVQRLAEHISAAVCVVAEVEPINGAVIRPGNSGQDGLSRRPCIDASNNQVRSCRIGSQRILVKVFRVCPEGLCSCLVNTISILPIVIALDATIDNKRRNAVLTASISSSWRQTTVPMSSHHHSNTTPRIDVNPA